MSRSDVASDAVQVQPRRQRHYGRNPTGRTTRTTTEAASPSPSIADSSVDTSTELKSADKVPVYRVRGRNKNKLQSTESDRIESTTSGSYRKNFFIFFRCRCNEIQLENIFREFSERFR